MKLDIKEMAPLTLSAAYSNNFIAPWSHLANNIRNPVICQPLRASRTWNGPQLDLWLTKGGIGSAVENVSH
jgi:hypothetical protein